MSKYKEYSEEYKKIYITTKQTIYSYLGGLIISLFITLPLFLFTFNIAVLSYDYALILITRISTTLLFIYLILYFKDKALIEYNNEFKKIHLAYIRNMDFTIALIIVVILFVILLLI